MVMIPADQEDYEPPEHEIVRMHGEASNGALIYIECKCGAKWSVNPENKTFFGGMTADEAVHATLEWHERSANKQKTRID